MAKQLPFDEDLDYGPFGHDEVVNAKQQEPSRYFDVKKAQNYEMPYVYTTDGATYWDNSIGGNTRGTSPQDDPGNDAVRSSRSRSGSGSGSGSRSSGTGGSGSVYPFQFTDPATKYLESLAQQQLRLYEQQAAQMAEEVKRKQAVRAQTEAAVKTLSEFINKRVGELQGPAYTGSEAEVLRTRQLDPIERDRTAAKQRALENIGSRGFDPSSGIAQELLNKTDRGFDEMRSTAQGDLAYRQIAEERSREQEAQQLLQYLAQLPEASARGDLNFVTYLNSLVNQPRLEALPLASQMAELPNSRIASALQVLGTPGAIPANPTLGYLGLLNNAQGNRALSQNNSSALAQGLAAIGGYLFQP